MSAQTKVVRVRQGSPEWHAFRASHIGSSDAPVICGESPYRSALDLYAEKIGAVQEVPDVAQQRIFQVGTHMEGIILQMYQEETGRKVRKGRVLESRDLPWLSASLDGETEDGRIVEAKNTSSSRWDNGVPADVQVQVQHQMGVTGARVADVAVWTGRAFTVYPVPFEPGLWEGIFGMESAFRERLRLRMPPRPDGSESSRKAIGRLFPEASGDLLQGDAQTRQLVQDLIAAKANAKDLESQIAAMENTIRFLIGDHDGIEGDGWGVTYRRNKDSERVSWTDYASSLEAIIAERVPEIIPADEIQTIRSIYTSIVPGPRVLRVKGAKG